MNPDLYQELVRQINSLQKQVDGLVKPEVGRWMNWTPTVTQGGAVAKSIIYARYIILNNTAIVIGRMDITGAGVAGNAITIGGQPAAIQSASNGSENVIGIGMILDATVARYSGPLISSAATSWIIQPHNTAGGGIGIVPSFALANGDVVSFEAAYERA